MKFPMLKLGEVARVGDGAHASIERRDHGVLYLTAKNFKQDGLSLTGVELISEADFERHFAEKSEIVKRPKLGDLVFSIIGSIGTPYLVRPDDFFGLSSSVAILRPLTSKMFPQYLYFWMISETFQSYVANTKSGVAQGFLSLGMIRQLPVSVPPLPLQRKIAAVLSAYDDLIENNSRRIALLEKMAEELYQEWFVRLRFPGHENVKVVKGVPEGWEVKRIGEICSEVRSHVRKKGLSANVRYVGLEHITPRSMILRDHGLASDISSDKLGFKAGEILFGKIRPYLEKVSIAQFSGICSTDAIVLQPADVNLLGFTFLTVSSRDFLDLANTSSKGTKMPRADWDFLESQSIIVPSDSVLTHFEETFSVIFRSSCVHYSSIENLKSSRDRLLSRLMSGKIDLTELDIAFPPSMKEE